MNSDVVHFLKKSFPYVLVLFLWRLSLPIFNPGGILMFIPIFYCIFIRPVPWFMAYSLLFCFLMDYSVGTVLFWTAMLCFFYAAYGFQNFIDLSQSQNNGIAAFSAFLGTGLIILLLRDFTLANMAHTIWTFAWCAALYIPLTQAIRRLYHD